MSTAAEARRPAPLQLVELRVEGFERTLVLRILLLPLDLLHGMRRPVVKAAYCTSACGQMTSNTPDWVLSAAAESEAPRGLIEPSE